jgi:phenylacetate-CoA ligase
MHRWLVRNILFPLQERIKGHPTPEILREMERVDRFSASELERYCNQKLSTFIESCYSRVPYVSACMKCAGVTPAEIQTPADLARLPIMTKAVVRQHRQGLRSTAAGKLSKFSTGGSTGEPLVFDLSKRRIASRVACRQRVAQWWGLSVGHPELALWGSPIELTRQDWARKVRDWLMATRLLPAFDMTEAAMARYLDIMEQGHWEQIFGYPSSLYQLCLYARKQGRALRRAGIRVVFVTSEVLFPYQRELISEMLGCPVANGYGGRDSGFIAHECPQGGMHILTDAVIVEVVDPQGRPLPPGEPGEIVATDLYSEEAPFLRYATGDVGALSTRQCGCGRALPLIERIVGRSNDCIMAPDGRNIHDLALVYPLREIEGIDSFRIHQLTIKQLHVQIVRNEHFRGDSEEKLRKSWRALLRAPVEITFEYLPRLLADRSGKFRHIISDLVEHRELESLEGAAGEVKGKDRD